MPLAHSPLFHPRLVRDRLAAQPAVDDLDARRALMRPWIENLRRGLLDDKKEVSLHGEFLQRVFGDVLGYRTLNRGGPASGATAPPDDAARPWELEPEKSMGGGKSADAALGFFGAGHDVVLAPVELKGARQSLDHALGRVLTPVQQAWDYANHSPGCRWIIVSNYRETRLYSTARTPSSYETFLLEDLDETEALRRFLLLLSRDSLLARAPGERSLLDELLVRSVEVEAEITGALYRDYRALRHELYAHLGHVHSNLPAELRLRHTQTILDRILFIAFAEDRGLLPAGTITEACKHRDKYHPRPVWQNFVAVFRWINEGNAGARVPAYNGGLFQPDPELDELEVSDAICDRFLSLARYDFKSDVSVEVLGHIFEQSITDLEEMRQQARAEAQPDAPGEPSAPADTRRRAEGIFYTPSYITRYIVEQTLGRTLEGRWQAVLEEHRPDAMTPPLEAGEDRPAGEKDAAKRDAAKKDAAKKDAAKKDAGEKQAGKKDAAKKEAKKDSAKREKEAERRWIAAWEAYREVLKRVRVLDPACGSGAFLIAAFDLLAREYERVNAALAALRGGQAGLFDLTSTVLNSNLFGVDLNSESVEITKLSLWLKTAMYGQKLTWLDRNIKVGNSVVSDITVHPRAFDWSAGTAAADVDPAASDAEAVIDARWREGFDVVIGNPPYVRQERLAPIKEHLAREFRAWHGMADLFVYFLERGLGLLKPGGRLGFIVANKWLRAGYAEPLRGLLAKEAAIESIVDFGHAPIFPDADTFPCVITLRRPAGEAGAVAAEHELEVTQLPREELRGTNVGEYVEAHRYRVPQRRLGAAAWSLEPPALEALMEKIQRVGVPLRDFAGSKPFYGIKTGFNDAFLIDTATRDRLVRSDPGAAVLLQKFLRGQSIERWSAPWEGEWILLIPSSSDRDWPWSGKDDAVAEAAFAEAFPSIHAFMKPHEAALRQRADKGRCWWELRACAYYDRFARPKIIYQEIQFHPCYALDESGLFTNNKVFFLPSADPWLLAVLNSPLMWWHNWRYLPHMKDEALSPVGVKMESLPIAPPSDEAREAAAQAVARLVALTRAEQEARAAVLDSLRMQYAVETPGQKLESFVDLDGDAFVAEVLRRRPKAAGTLKPAVLKALRALHAEESEPLRAGRREALGLERRLADLVNAAYGLTPEEVSLLWATAPPRMPIAR